MDEYHSFLMKCIGDCKDRLSNKQGDYVSIIVYGQLSAYRHCLEKLNAMKQSAD